MRAMPKFAVPLMLALAVAPGLAAAEPERPGPPAVRAGGVSPQASQFLGLGMIPIAGVIGVVTVSIVTLTVISSESRSSASTTATMKRR